MKLVGFFDVNRGSMHTAHKLQTGNMTRLERKKKKNIIILAIVIIFVALLLEAAILKYVHDKSIYRTSKVLVDRVITVLNKNDENKNELIKALKEEYIVRAKSVAYIIDAKPQVEYDVEELQKIANLMSIDEIHLFDEKGCIYSGTLPKYFGFSFNSGEQMGYFKPMLEDKELTLCQDVTPNTAEQKKMMYAMTWNEDKTKMIQVGIEPTRLLNEMRQNQISNVVADIPVYNGMEILVADVDQRIISGATDSSKIGKTLDETGITFGGAGKEEGLVRQARVGGKSCRCMMRQDSTYVVVLTVENAFYRQGSFIAILIVGIYLVLASCCMAYMLIKVMREKYEKETLLYISNTDELTGCLNRHAYEADMGRLDLAKEWAYISMDLDGLKRINDSKGHAAGDELIRAAAECMKDSFREIGKVYRIGGDEFVVIITEQTKQLDALLGKFEADVNSRHGGFVDSMTISYGYAFSTEKKWDSIYDISKAADRRMYENKERHYHENNIDRR